MLKRWSRTDKYPILDASGAVAAVALYSFDVTDRMDQSYAVSDLRLHLTGAQEMRELLDLLQGASSYPLVDKALYRVRSHATNYEKMLAPLVARFAPSAKSKEFFLAPETIIVVVGGFADESNMLPRSPLISLAMHPEMYIVTSGDESFYALTLMHALDAASLCTPPIVRQRRDSSHDFAANIQLQIEVHVHSDGRTEIFEVLVTFSSSADPQTTPHLALHLNAAKRPSSLNSSLYSYFCLDLASRNYCTFDWRKESDKWTLTLLASLAPLEVQDELSVLPDTKNVLKRSRYDSY